MSDEKYIIKTHCECCNETIKVVGFNEEITKRELFKKLSIHKMTELHNKNYNEYYRTGYTSLTVSTKCECGETVSLSWEIYKANQNERMKDLEKALLIELTDHQSTQSCITIINRNTIINELLKD